MTLENGETNAKKQNGETKQLRWSTSMDRFLIEVLVDEATNQGHKVDKSFKKTSFVRAAKEISAKFQLVCNAKNVENRMKTIKKNFKEVKQIECNNSGMSWDDNLKMWNCSDDVYKDHIRAHLKVDQYLNKPIFMYDKLCIVCGDDQATGTFAKSSTDAFDNDEMLDTSIEDITPSINSTQVGLNPVASPPIRKHGKRVRPVDEFGVTVNKLTEVLCDMTNTMKKSKSHDHTEELYCEVMKTEGFDESVLESAFDYLVENDKIARSFLVRKTGGRCLWL